MFCTKCGAENSDEAKFCKQCGNGLNKTQSTNTVVNTVPTPTGDDNPQVQMKCGLCDYVGPVKKGRRVVSQILAWLPMLLFMWIVPVIYYMLTDKYVCPKCDSNILSIKNNEGVYKAQKRGNNALVVILVVLVGIAFVGILASVVLASLNTARDKGADASVKANLSNLKAQAELYYDSNSDSYMGLCKSSGVTALASSIPDTRKQKYICNDSVGSYVAVAPLSNGNSYCVDSTGVSIEVTNPSSIIKNCSGLITTGQTSLADELKEASDYANSLMNLPAMIDEETQLTRLYASADNKMNYDYKLVNYTINDVDWSVLEETVLPSLEKSFCNDTSFEYYREKNVPMKWNYYDKNNKLFGYVELDTSDCI